MDLVLIRLSDMSFSLVLSDPHCRYSLSTGGFDFNQIVIIDCCDHCDAVKSLSTVV